MESQLTLAERYTYGNRSQIKSFYGNAEGKTDGERLRNELLMESPNRQRAMINLAQRQIETQERAAQEIVASNIAGAEMVSSQISQQTQEMRLQIQEQTSQLQSTFESVGASISNSVSSAADQVSNSIDSLGDRLSMEFAEVRWQMVQQNKTLDKILNVLQENRSNEARQLVNQGLRLYVNDQYEKAEERFLRALDFDMTDYQVLMNLGYIELHKENADAAMSFFQDALSLPASLDSSAKARALWSIARINYVKQDYQKALFYAEESLKIESDNPKNIFIAGVYAALAGDKNHALHRIQSSIEMDSDFFSLAAVEPDLESMRQEVLDLLGKMSIESYRKATKSLEEIQKQRDQIKSYVGNKECPDFVPQIERSLDDAKTLLKKPSYSNCIRCINNLVLPKRLCEAGNKILPIISRQINQLDKLSQEKFVIERNIELKTVKSQQIQTNITSFIPQKEFYLFVLSVMVFTVPFLGFVVIFFILDISIFSKIVGAAKSPPLSAIVAIIPTSLITFIIARLYFSIKNKGLLLELNLNKIQAEVSELQKELKHYEKDEISSQLIIQRLSEKLNNLLVYKNFSDFDAEVSSYLD